MKINQSLVECLCATVQNFESLKNSDQVALAKLIVKSVTSQHRVYKDCFVVSTVNKLFYLGYADKFTKLNNQCQIFVPTYGNTYSNGKMSFAKPWALSDSAIQAIELFRLITLNQARGTITAEKFLSNFDQKQRDIVTKYSEPGIDRLIQLDKKRNPTTWIKSKDLNGNVSQSYKSLKDADMICAIPVNVGSLADLVEDISTMDFDQLRSKYPDIKTVSDQRIAERKRVLFAAASTFALATALANGNTIPTTYTEAHNGRLVIEGMSLQNVPKVVRNACLKGQHSYDMSSAHWRLLHSIVQSNSYFNEMPETQKYIDNKSGYREAIANETGLPVSAVKQALIAIIFGGQCNMSSFNTFAEIAGHNKATQRKLVDALTPLAEEVKEAGKFIVALYEKKTSANLKGLRNDAGKLIKFDTKPSPAQKLAFILQGLESELLRIVIKHNASDLMFLIHDGIVSNKEINLDSANAEIKERFDVQMTWDHEVIECDVHVEEVETIAASNTITVNTSWVNGFKSSCKGTVRHLNKTMGVRVAIEIKPHAGAYSAVQANNIGGGSICLLLK